MSEPTPREVVEGIRDIAEILLSLSKAFEQTGNSKMDRELRDYGVRLLAAATVLRNAIERGEE